MDLLLQIFVYAFVGIMLIGVTMPIWLPILSGCAEAFVGACELFARFEDWRRQRHTSPR